MRNILFYLFALTSLSAVAEVYQLQLPAQTLSIEYDETSEEVVALIATVRDNHSRTFQFGGINSPETEVSAFSLQVHADAPSFAGKFLRMSEHGRVGSDRFPYANMSESVWEVITDDYHVFNIEEGEALFVVLRLEKGTQRFKTIAHLREAEPQTEDSSHEECGQALQN